MQCTFLVSVPESESDVCCFTSAQRTHLDPPWRLLQTAVLAGCGPLRRCRPRLGQAAWLSSENPAVVFVSRVLLRSGPRRILARCLATAPSAQPCSPGDKRDLVLCESSP